MDVLVFCLCMTMCLGCFVNENYEIVCDKKNYDIVD